MKYTFTPDEAQTIADGFIKFYKKKGFEISIEKPFAPLAPMITTLTAEKNGLSLLLEAQKNPSFGGSLIDLSRWLSSQRAYCELYIITDESSNLKGNLLIDIANEGVGLLIVDNNFNVTEHRKAKNFALIVTPEPTLSFGTHKLKIQECINKFNDGERKDGLRDLCEFGENLTNDVANTASRKGYLISSLNLNRMDWSSKIDALASPNQYNSGYLPVFTASFMTDLHSFRNARNLFDHPPKNKRDAMRRERQFAERMMMGPRIISELISIKRKIR